MECLTPTVSLDIFVDDHFTFFCLLTHLEVNKIRATGVLNKNRLRKCTIIRRKQLQKKERGHFKQHTSSKKASLAVWQWFFRTTAGQFTWILLNLVNLRDMFGVGTKLKKTYSRTTKSVPLLQLEHGFCQQNGPKHSQVLVSEWKDVGSFILFEWWMMFFRVRGYCIVLKMKMMSLCLF